MKLLLVEDDYALATGLAAALKREHFLVCNAYSGQEALAELRSFDPDMVVLDLGLPDMDGMDVLCQLRKRSAAMPVLVLTARDALDDRVGALDLGADDYLVKPFDMPELLARLRVMSRRLNHAATSEVCVGAVMLDTASHRVTVAGEKVELRRREYVTLKKLLENVGRVQTKSMLERELYGGEGEVGSNAVEVHISHLRKKLPSGFIKTIRGIGYTVNPPSAE